MIAFMATPAGVINIVAARTRRNGRPPFVPADHDRDVVQAMRANGIDVATIAGALKISINTLKKYFRQELADSHELVKAKLGVVLVKAASNGDVSALKFWLVMRGGPEWRIPKEPALPPRTKRSMSPSVTTGTAWRLRTECRGGGHAFGVAAVTL